MPYNVVSCIAALFFFSGESMKNILIIGGDKRSITAYNELKKQGFNVETKGLFTGDKGEISDCDVILLPVPTSKDKKTVFCPLTDEIIPLSDIVKQAEKRLVISCGYDFSSENSVDILTLDGYSYLNAVPTAEGAIAFAIDKTPFTLWKANVLVTGFGRVSKILCSRLKAFGCNITVSARKDRDFSLLDALYTDYISTSDICGKIKNYDIIFNTLDVRLFENPEILKGKYLFDLSSKGCLDFNAPRSTDINAFKLPGIPGKTSPETAGKILAMTAVKLIKEM